MDMNGWEIALIVAAIWTVPAMLATIIAFYNDGNIAVDDLTILPFCIAFGWITVGMVAVDLFKEHKDRVLWDRKSLEPVDFSGYQIGTWQDDTVE